jgi:hypothetical protein
MHSFHALRLAYQPPANSIFSVRTNQTSNQLAVLYSHNKSAHQPNKSKQAEEKNCSRMPCLDREFLIWMNSAHPVRVPCPSMWCCWRED